MKRFVRSIKVVTTHGVEHCSDPSAIRDRILQDGLMRHPSTYGMANSCGNGNAAFCYMKGMLLDTLECLIIYLSGYKTNLGLKSHKNCFV